MSNENTLFTVKELDTFTDQDFEDMSQLVTEFGWQFPDQNDEFMSNLGSYVESPTHGSLVARRSVDSRIVGMVNWALHRPTKSLFLEGLVVTPIAREQGVGEALLRYSVIRAEDFEAQELRAASAEPMDERAARLFRRLGFVEQRDGMMLSLYES